MKLSFTVSNSPILKNIRGIFATEKIKKGQLIESCPIILFTKKEDYLIDETILGNYVYEWNKLFDCLVLGYGSLFNHSYSPNAVYKRDYKKQRMNYYAISEIKKGEEILINYNGKVENKTPLDPAHIDFKR